MPEKDQSDTNTPPPPMIKTAFTGLIMGIAMLIPGVSGGTMILAMGLYTDFIDAVADLTAFRFNKRRTVFLAIIAAFALVSIKGLAGIILFLLFHHGAAMYALFIGMTLGGAPLLARSIGRLSGAAGTAIAAGIALMILIVLARDHAAVPDGTITDLVAGFVAATTMVLPGISGSYMLLILGQYDRVVGSVRDLDFGIIIPVGIGAVAGVVLLAHVLKLLLHRRRVVTLGFLLGMLLGSIIGLWPFGRTPSEKAMQGRSTPELIRFAERQGIEGFENLQDEALASHIARNWSHRTISDYAPATVAIAAAALIAGFALTHNLAKRGPVVTSDPS